MRLQIVAFLFTLVESSLKYPLYIDHILLGKGFARLKSKAI